jgi:ribosomal protein S18 acetylase RimI-like enzyme
MDDHIAIRLAGIDDFDAIVAAGDRVFDHPVNARRAKEFLSDPRHHMMLAFEGPRIVGMASAFHYVHPDKNPQMFVNEVGVLEGYRNRGIGRALVRRLCKHAGSLGCMCAWIATEESNISARKAFVAAGGSEDRQRVVLINLPVGNGAS